MLTVTEENARLGDNDEKIEWNLGVTELCLICKIYK